MGVWSLFSDRLAFVGVSEGLHIFSSRSIYIQVLVGKKVSHKIIAIGDIKKIFCSVTFNWKIDGGSRQVHNGAGFELIKKDHTREILTCIWFNFPEKADEAVVFAGELSSGNKGDASL